MKKKLIIAHGCVVAEGAGALLCRGNAVGSAVCCLELWAEAGCAWVIGV